MNRTDEQVRQAARDGAALLDTQNPGWASRIDVAELALDECSACVLGQTYAGVVDVDREHDTGYEAGVRALSGFEDQPWGSLQTDSSKFALEYGFLGLTNREYEVLDDEWRRLIAERA